MMMHPYSFVVLQYRHDVWVGEALNIGVLMLCQNARYLKLKCRAGRGRLARAYPDLDHDALRLAVKALQRRFDSISSKQPLLLSVEGADVVGKNVLGVDDSSLAWGVSGSGATSDAEHEHEKIFERFVGRYDPEAGREVRTDEMVFEAVRTRLEVAEVLHRFQPHVVRSPFAEIRFEHAVRNDTWHVIQPLSFDSADADRMLYKAAKWAGILQSIADSPEPVRPYFVTGAPQDRSLLAQYRKMQDFLRSSPTRPMVCDEAQSNALVSEVAASLQ